MSQTTDRVEQARAEISRRRTLATTAAHHTPPRTEDEIRTALCRFTRIRPDDAAHFGAVAALPHVLPVLDLADGLLTRHAQHSDVGLADGDWCPYDGFDYPCPDLRAVLEVYAPARTTET